MEPPQESHSIPDRRLLYGDSLFIRWTIYRPVTVFMLFVALLVVGIIAYPRIPVELAPRGISTGSISVWIPVPESTPQEVLEQISRPAEELVRTIPGIREIYTSSSSNGCHVRIEFNAAVEADKMTADVRERLDRAKAKWPQGVDRYFIWRGRMDADMPIFIVAIGIEADEEKVDVNEVFENIIQNRLLAVDGVARVTFWGLIEKRVTIDLDNDRVAAHAVPVYQLIQRLKGDNMNVTGGKIRDGDREFLVRSVGKFQSFDEIRDYPVEPGLRLADIAQVGYYRALRNRWSRVNGLPSKVVVVHKDSSANAVETCRELRRIFHDEFEKSLPRRFPGLKKLSMHPFLDQGEVIEDSISSLRESGLYGGLFAVIVLYAFLRRVRVTLLVALSIPFSLLITIVWMFFQKGTFNVLSMMGLSLGIGMLVDNSIVVVENIIRLHGEGKGLLAAAVEGVREIGLAVTLATLTTVVVFLPIMFIGDPRFKTIYQEVGGPLCVSVLASLLVALVFIPQGMIYFHRRGRRLAGAAGRGSAVTGGGLPMPGSFPNRWCEGILDRCLEHRFEAFLIFTLIFLSTWSASQLVKKNEGPIEGGSRMSFIVRLPKNLNLGEANDIFTRLEKVFDERREELRIRSITSWFDRRGGDLHLYFNRGVRVNEEEFFKKAEAMLPRIPDVKVRQGGDEYADENKGNRVRIYIRGTDLPTLFEIGDRVQREIKSPAFPEVIDVALAGDQEEEEVQVTVNREWAQHYGINAGSVSNMVSWAIRGAMLPDYQTEDRELPFWIRYQDADKENVEELNAIPVYRPDGQSVRLENVASYHIQPSPGEIRRVNGKMTIAYVARVDAPDAFPVRERIRRALEGLSLPEGFEATLNLRQGGFQYDFEMTVLALILAVSLIFFLMGVLFESFILPFAVMLSIPHAFFGSLWSLYLTGTSLDAMGMVGFVMLVGVVVNNAIVLVAAINRFRQEGLERRLAILHAMRIRFRPIWMTALTTIFGLAPLVIFPQAGEGMDYKSMAVVLMGGLATSTFFTLFVVPLFYTFLDDLQQIALALLFRPKRGEAQAARI
ncbi:MAG: efflux RND transporter permease subunit [Planctomycetes bacterium]|nr:efflux RND transporter permease subunit [Planctomycetota bacterium]